MSIYLSIDGVTPKGSATVQDIGGKKNLIAIDSVSWSAVRGVGIEIGNANNADQGMVALGEINISRGCDGASANMTTFLYAPGAEGKKVYILFTKPGREGEGAQPYMMMTLDAARMSSYNVGCTSGSLPNESFSFTYTILAIDYYYETDSGKIEKGPTVTYDATIGQCTSKAS